MIDPWLVDVRVKVNLRWPLRPYCLATEHDWRHVYAGDAFSTGYDYCGRCGYGWRYAGLRKCWLSSQHRWGDDPNVLGPSRRADGTPFRAIERCVRCHQHRVLDCATGEVVGA